jgi:hypothetical protein
MHLDAPNNKLVLQESGQDFDEETAINLLE